MAFRSWDLYEYLLLQRTTKHSWPIKTATQLEKPRYVIFALQICRKNIMAEDPSRFDHCNLTNVKLYLNSECYSREDMNLDFGKNRWAILYDMYTRFCRAYLGYENLQPSLSITEFLYNGPFTVIDCCRQSESIKSATIDVRFEFETNTNVPENSSAYCLIIHDLVI
ncbi:uncharacterized protein LOC113004940, partial [Solenopsis invicta]|uniref:uncharacterized protein LOC113004940 n=1 Tax=Solenopsis invicta TaxID=13686 RepID=UPI00193D4F17